jgi:tetratricopeptide (TPR) repeat protein
MRTLLAATPGRLALTIACVALAAALPAQRSPTPEQRSPNAAEQPPDSSAADPSAALLLPIPRPTLDTLEAAAREQVESIRRQVDEGVVSAPVSDRAEALGLLGKVYHAYGLLEAARAAYLNAAALAPDTYAWAFYLGYLAESEGRFGEAEHHYRRALSLYPDSLATLVHLSDVVRQLQRPDEAKTLLQRALDGAPELAAAKARLGEIALAQGEHERAVELLEEALAAVPDANRLHYPLALAYRGLGDLERAKAHLDQRGAVGARPPEPLIDELESLKQGELVHVMRARMAYRFGRFQEAAALFAKALEANPSSVSAELGLGVALAQIGDRAGAIAHLRRALELEPDNPTARFNLASLLVEDDPEVALSELEALARQAPEDFDVRLLLAQLLERRGNLAAALSHYQTIVAAMPGNEPARVGEANVLIALGDYPEALRRLDEANQLMPQSGLVARSLARFLAAVPDPTLRDGERALELAQRVFAARPNQGHAETLALALGELGQCQAAADLLGQIVTALAEAEGQPGVDVAGLAAQRAQLEARRQRYLAGPPCDAPIATPPAN